MVFVGLVLGICREFLVTKYYLAVSARLAWLGSGLSLGIALLDLLVIAGMIRQDQMGMAIGYAVGESAGTYLAIKCVGKRNR